MLTERQIGVFHSILEYLQIGVFVLNISYGTTLLHNAFKLDKKAHLYSFDSGFAEVSFHLNIDLHIAHIAVEKKEKSHLQ